MECPKLGNMSLTSRTPNVAFLGLLISLCLFSDLGVGTAEQTVGTESHVVLEVGARGILPCRIQRRGYSVEWKRQLSPDETELLVSLDPFFNVGKRDGPGYEAGLFNITEDYSLVIKDVKVKDEGLYMCSFSDYQTGNIFRNSTRVFVQALPREPFPTIQECTGKDVNPSGVCTLTVDRTSNLTCLVVGYYPDIDLFFLRGSENVTSTHYEEWNNTDGTKSQSATISINVNDEPYECVASRLPGMAGNRSVLVIVKARPQAHAQRAQGTIAAAIIVSVLIAGICLSIAVVIKCRSAEGPVSKFELWTLVTKAKEKDDFKKLKKALSRLRHLSKTDASKLQEDEDFYESLCEWKSKTSSDRNQRKKLYSACSQVGMLDITRTLEDLVRNTSYGVSIAEIEHILWEIGDTRKIAELLKDLKLAHEEVITASEKGIRDVINIARGELMAWLNRYFDIHPLVILSLKLDDLQCETNFFKIHKSQKEEIDEKMMKGMCCGAFKDHYMYLWKALRKHKGKDLPHELGEFVEENNASLFNTFEMLRDWIRDEECSNYEKRNKLQKAVEASRHSYHTDAKWPPDDDLRVIASFLSKKSMEHLCSKLDIKSPPEEVGQEERFHALTEWRDIHASSKDLMEKRTELFNALKEVKRGGLVPRAKGPLVYTAELVDLAFHLFAQNLLPFTEALGIGPAILVAYRRAFEPSHMTKGTIGLVRELFESEQRSHLLNQLKEVPNVLASAMVALDVSFEEVCAISFGPANFHKQNITHNAAKKSESFSPGDNRHDRIMKKPSSSCPDESKSIPLICEDITSNEYVKEQSDSKVNKPTTDGLSLMLTSASKVEDPSQVSPEYSAFIKQFQLWRKQSHMTAYNFRLAVAKAVAGLRIKVKPHLISDFLRGDCNKEGIPFTFIYDMIKTMDADQVHMLGMLTGLAPVSPLAGRLSSFFSEKEEVSQKVHTWVREWILQIKQSEWKKDEDGFLMTSEIAKQHKEFNDKLVAHGFIDLAREIMISEQQLMMDEQSA